MSRAVGTTTVYRKRGDGRTGLTLTQRFRFSPRTARSPIMVPVPQSHLSGDNVGGPPMTSSPQLRPLGELLGTDALGIDLSRPLDEATFAWDELATMHRGAGDYRPAERRVMLRTIVYAH